MVVVAVALRDNELRRPVRIWNSVSSMSEPHMPAGFAPQCGALDHFLNPYKGLLKILTYLFLCGLGTEVVYRPTAVILADELGVPDAIPTDIPAAHRSWVRDPMMFLPSG